MIFASVSPLCQDFKANAHGLYWDGTHIAWQLDITPSCCLTPTTLEDLRFVRFRFLC
jgi:hypothetical protein